MSRIGRVCRGYDGARRFKVVLLNGFTGCGFGLVRSND